MLTLAGTVARLQSAAQADRELDFWCWWYGASTESKKEIPDLPPEDYAAWNIKFGDSPRYTHSVDAALTLAPTDSAVGLTIYLEDNPNNKNGRFRATIMPPLSMERASDQTVYAASLPLAICIASLKAKHKM